MMEQNNDRATSEEAINFSNNSLKVHLSSNDLSLLDSSYQTAIEEEEDGDNANSLRLKNASDQRRTIASLSMQIKSQKLVDSNNEESTDDDDDAELRVKLTDCAQQSIASEYNLDNSQCSNFNKAASEEAALDNDDDDDDERLRIDRKRSTWRQQSLMNRPQMTTSGGSRLIDRDEQAERQQQQHQRRRQFPSCQTLDASQLSRSSPAVATAAATNECVASGQLGDDSINDDAKRRSSLFTIGDSDCSNTQQPTEQQQHHSRQNNSNSIMIRVEQYNSLSNDCNQSIELNEHDESVVQSIKQQNSTLNNLMNFHQKNSLIGAAAGGVKNLENNNQNKNRLDAEHFILGSIPSRSSSAIDLSAPPSSSISNHGQSSEATMLERERGQENHQSASTASGDKMTTGGGSMMNGQDQAKRFTRTLSPHLIGGGGGGGSLSDYSNQIQSIGRILDTNAISQRQIESRVKNWKRSNKIITNIHENPFNMHLDLLEKFEHQVGNDDDQLTLLAKAADNNNDVYESSAAQQNQFNDDRVMSNDIGEDKTATTNRQPQPKQEQLNDCALHLTHLYRRNQTIMDNNSEFRALLYNIICCLLVQDDQVLATQSVGKMLDVIRAHLDSVTRVYSTASSSSSTATAGATICTAEQSSCSNPNSRLHVNNNNNCSHIDRQTSDSDNIDPHSASNIADKLEKTSETPKPNNTKRFDNISALSPNSNNNNHRSQKPIDFRRISSVSFNDEQLINDLCDDRRRLTQDQLNYRSGSLSLEKTTESGGRDSPWAYQELSSERRRPRLVSSSTCSNNNNNSQRLQLNTSQSSIDDNNRQQHLNDCTNDSGTGTMCECQTTTSSSSEKQQELLLSSRLLSSSRQSIENNLERQRLSSYHGRRRSSSSANNDLLRFKPKQQPSYISTDDYLTNTNNDCWTSTTTFGGGGCDDGDVDEFTSSQGTATIVASAATACAGRQTNCDFESNSMEQSNDVASRRAELEWTLNKLINLELKHTWLTSNDTLKRAIRKIGVPNEIRGKVWLILVEQLIGSRYDAKEFLAEANKTIAIELEVAEAAEAEAAAAANDQQSAGNNQSDGDEELQSILKQIELDINRTMPGHRLFEDGAEGGIRLRRILVAYSVHVNREIAYCQGFNFIVALLLSVFDGDEEKALRGFVCIVDHIFPSKYYFDHYLTGARADQFLLADFICDQLIKNPTMAERKMVEGVTSSITLNWFISLFHGAVPTLTRLTILDHFMLEGVKALFRFTMAILYLAFQVAPPSSCEVFAAIRNTAKNLYDIKLLLSIVDQIKLPKDSYFAIRRSFYMVQSSFNSDQFYMQSLSNDAKRNLNPNKPLNVQQLPDTKPPALSFITNASPLNQHLSATSARNSSSSLGGLNSSNHPAGQATKSPVNNSFTIRNSICTDSMNGLVGPRLRTSANRTKVCIQSLGKLGRSHIKIIDANVKTNERSLMSPLRNCIVIGISNCGKNLIVARQSSRRSYKTFREQDLTFHIHEICTEIFDGFYLEEANLALIITHQGEVFKIDTTRCFTDQQDGSTETLMLRESHSIVDHERVKLRLASLDELTNLLWIYVECEDSVSATKVQHQKNSCNIKSLWNLNETTGLASPSPNDNQSSISVGPKPNFRHNNPFLSINDNDEELNNNGDQLIHQQMTNESPTTTTSQQQQAVVRPSFHRKIILIDIITFDLFSAFTMNPNFGELLNIRTSLVAFCQLTNQMSSQFSSKIIQIGPTGRYEQLLSFSDVVDYRVSVSESCKQKFSQPTSRQTTEDQSGQAPEKKYSSQRYASIRGLLSKSGSLNNNDGIEEQKNVPQCSNGEQQSSGGTLAKYYRSLIKSHSTVCDRSNSLTGRARRQDLDCVAEQTKPGDPPNKNKPASNMIRDNTLRSIITSGLGDFSGLSETNYIPVNMAFIFRNGKIALFEFTESYAIHTREAQLDRYDYSKVIDVTKDGNVFIVTILTIFDKLIKVVI